MCVCVCGGGGQHGNQIIAEDVSVKTSLEKDTWYVFHCSVTKALTSIHKYPDAPEPS